MQIIFIKENQKEQWDEFIASNPDGSFLQSWAWSEFQKSFGRKVWRLAIMKNNEIVSAALIIKHNLPFGWSYFYCPRGPLINPKSPARLAMPARSRYSVSGGQSIAGRQIPNPKLIELFFEEIKKMAKKEKAVFLRVDPSFVIPAKAGIYDNKKYNLEKWIPACAGMTEEKMGMTEERPGMTSLLSFPRRRESDFRQNDSEQVGMTRETKPTQPQHTLILDITKNENEILSRMKQKTRYNIRLAQRKGVKIKKISQPNDQEIQTFLNLSIQTSKRDKFKIHPKEYYQKMLKILCANSTAKLFLAEYQNEIIAANIVIFFSDKAIYLHGASSNSHRQVMSPYLLHWEQIKEAKKLGCKSYDFWGIEKQSPIANRQSPIAAQAQSAWAGITRFKKGFGGEEISYPESWDIIFKPVLYKIYKVARKIL